MKNNFFNDFQVTKSHNYIRCSLNSCSSCKLDYNRSPKKPKKALLASNKIFNYDPVLPINMNEIKKEAENDAYCKLCVCMMLLFFIITCVCLLIFLKF